MPLHSSLKVLSGSCERKVESPKLQSRSAPILQDGGDGDNEARLKAEVVELVRWYGRYRYRRVTALLRAAGWLVSDKRVERIWRSEGLKV